MYNEMANSHPSLARGMVWCTVCKRSQKVNSSQAFQTGWPKCCGYTMTIDSPEEREAMKAKCEGK